MKKRIWSLGIIIGLFFSGNIYAQDAFESGIQSPTAASLGEYALAPISLYTGKYSRSIPLYTLNVGDYSLNVGLSYNYNGFKVESIPGSMGLGWSLNAGGVITRTVKQIRDEDNNGGYLYEYDEYQTINETDYSSVESGTWDGSPDIFYFNFNGIAGKFFLDKYGNFQVDSYRKLKIDWQNEATANSRFVITDTDGTKYTFGESQSYDQIQTKVQSTIPPDPPTTYQESDQYIVAWYLTKIEPVLGENILFTYDVESATTAYRARKRMNKKIQTNSTSGGGSTTELQIDNWDRKIRRVWVASISANGTTIDIDYAARTDFTEEKRVSSLSIKRGASTLKKYDFNPAYIGSSGENSRLILDDIEVFGLNNDQLPGWDFTYEDETLVTALPGINSKSVDYWGFYNAKANSGQDYPGYQFLNPSSNWVVTYSGMDLKPDATKSDIGLLTEVEFPTGGSENIFYEANTYSYISDDIDELYDFSDKSFSASFTNDPGNPVTYYTYSQTFDVNIGSDEQLKINISTEKFTDNDASVNCEIPSELVSDYYGTATIDDVNSSSGPGSSTPIVVGDGCVISLKAGTYEIVFEMYDQTYDQPMDIHFNWTDRDLVNTKTGGGHRVKKVVLHDGVSTQNDIEKKYSYQDLVNSNKSSGVLVSEYLAHYLTYVATRGIGTEEATLSVSIRSSNSLMHLGSSNGEYLGYEAVTESITSNGQDLKTIYKYISPRSYPDVYSQGAVPGFEPTSQDYARGALIEQQVLNSSGNLQYQKINQYTYSSESGVTPLNSTISPRIHADILGRIGSSGIQFNPATHEYELPVWSKLVTSKERFYSNNGQVFSERKTDYEYIDPFNTEVTKKTETNTLTSEQRITSYAYAHDYYQGMEDNNMVTQPYTVLVSNGSSAISKTWSLWDNTFSGAASGAWLPWRIWNWKGTGTPPTNPSFANSIQAQEILAYDEKSNPLEVSNAYGEITKFYYGSDASPFSQAGSGIFLTGIQKVQGTDDCISNCGTRPVSGDDLFTEALYDNLGRLTMIRDENNQTLLYEYDNFSRLISTQNQDIGFTKNEYFYSMEDHTSYNTSYPNYVNTLSYDDIDVIDFSSSSGWLSVNSTYNTFGVINAGETTVRMGGPSSYETMYMDPNSEDLLVKIDFYPDNTTGGIPHVYLDSGGDRFAINYLPSSDAFRIQYRVNYGSFVYPFTFPLNGTIDRWYTIEFEKSGSDLTAWVYPKGEGRDLSNKYKLEGSFPSSWKPHFRLTTYDNYFYAANLSIAKPGMQSVSYLDGLGREIQTQLRGGNKVIATETLYNERGLTEVVSRPIETTATAFPGFYTQGLLSGGAGFTPTSTGTEVPSVSPVHSYYAPIVEVANDEDFSYSQVQYEASSLARVLKNTLPGISHQMGSGKEVINRYDLNSSETFTINGTIWGIKTLNKTVAEDPDGKETITYMDGWGRTIVSGVNMNPANDDILNKSSTDLVTYFEYDERGNLIRVEDPEGYVTTYSYDVLGQLTSKKLPDQTHSHTYKYDKRGRLRFHRDPNLDAGSDHYYYIKYDELDRPSVTGIYESSNYFSDLVKVDDETFPLSSDPDENTYIEYYYDEPSTAYPNTNNLKGRLSWIDYGLGETYYSYNSLGLVEKITQSMPSLSFPDYHIEYQYDGLGRQTRMFLDVPGGTDYDLYIWYRYDELGRLKNVSSNSSNDETTAIQEAQYSYYADGQVKELNLGEIAQSVDYKYTIQGWLESINNPDALTESTSGYANDRFGMALRYNSGFAGGTSPTPLYSGNIVEIEWEQELAGTGTDEPFYSFTYDDANRLTLANYSDLGNTKDNSGGLDVSYSYDDNGNLTAIDRKGANDGTTDRYKSPTVMNYTSSTNKLSSLTYVDGVSSATKTITYDASGNMKTNSQQGITSVSYDWRNLPTQTVTGSGTMRYEYDGDGNRVKKQWVGYSTNYYIRGKDGEVIAIVNADGTEVIAIMLPGGIGQINY